MMASRWAQKSWRRFLRYGRVAALVTLCVLLVSPLRDVIFFPVLPTAWRTHTSLRLVRMLLDNQHFPITQPYSLGGDTLSGNSGLPSLKVDLNDVAKFVEKEDPYAEFHRQRELLQKRAQSEGENQAASEELALLESFKPIMTLEERAQLLFTLDVFVRACKEYGLTFFLFEGSLLGAYRHHGLVPWDDDVDLALNGSQWREVRNVLGNIPGFTLYAPPDSQWKFYLSALPPFHDKPFKWPNLDLFFFTERDPYVWALTWGVKNHLMLDVKHLLPLTSVQWERWMLPAPACSQRYVLTNYGTDACVTPTYVHKTNQERFGFQTGAVPCSRLYRYLPFVFRTPGGGKEVVETLKVGGKVIHNVTVPPPPPLCLE